MDAATKRARWQRVSFIDTGIVPLHVVCQLIWRPRKDFHWMVRIEKENINIKFYSKY
jgi:hypothetical protein